MLGGHRFATLQNKTVYRFLTYLAVLLSGAYAVGTCMISTSFLRC